MSKQILDHEYCTNLYHIQERLKDLYFLFIECIFCKLVQKVIVKIFIWINLNIIIKRAPMERLFFMIVDEEKKKKKKKQIISL